MQPVCPFTDQNALPRQRNAGRGGYADISDENSLPNGRALRALPVLNVEHELGETLVEDSRLDFERCLRAFQAILQPPQCGLGLRR